MSRSVQCAWSNLRLSNLGQTRWYTAPALVERRPKRLETSLYIGCAASARGRRQPYARRLAAAPAVFGRDLVQVGQHLELSRANAVERAFTEYENSAQHSTKVRSVLAFGCLSLLFAWPQQQPLRPPELRRPTNQWPKCPWISPAWLSIYNFSKV